MSSLTVLKGPLTVVKLLICYKSDIYKRKKIVRVVHFLGNDSEIICGTNY